jgi:hypothetical protein
LIYYSNDFEIKTVSSVSVMSLIAETYDTLLALTISYKCPLYCLTKFFLSFDEQLFINTTNNLTPYSSLTIDATF